MNWGGFPVGFRFAAKEITDDFKRKCWDTVIRAASYADLRDMFLHEATLDDSAAGMPVYIAIIGSPKVGPIQKNSALWHKDASLLGHLTFYRPFVQENYLELYAPSHSVGTFLPDGTVRPDEGVSFLPKKVIKTGFIPKKRKALFLSRLETAENIDGAVAPAMEKVAAHAPTFETERLNFAEGGKALYYAAAFRNALVYACSYETKAGEKIQQSYALLPGGKCMADVRSISDPEERNAFLNTILSWHGKGGEVLCGTEQNGTLPENCLPVNELKAFYRLQDAAEGLEVAFCEKKDAAFFKQLIQNTLIEI